MEYWENKSLENIDGEVWRHIKSYEDLYAISSHGRVKSLSRVIDNGCKGLRNFKEIIMSQGKDKNGYLLIILSKRGVKKTFKVHFLVSNAFIINYHNKKQINHKNGVKSDNHKDNLEWCTPSENIIHSFKVLKKKPTMIGRSGELSPRGKSVFCFTNNKKYGSLREAERDISIDHKVIARLCRDRDSFKGYTFSFL